MGAPMAWHLLAAGHELWVYNRTQAKAQWLIDAWAMWCATPAEVAAASDIVCTIIGMPEDVREVYLWDV